MNVMDIGYGSRISADAGRMSECEENGRISPTTAMQVTGVPSMGSNRLIEI